MARTYKRATIELAFREYFVGLVTLEGEQRMFCPLCEDPGTSNSPSASMNLEKMVWNCIKSNHGGTVADLVGDLEWDIRSRAMKARNEDKKFSDNRQSAADQARSQSSKLSMDKLVQWQENLVNNDKVLEYLYDERGFSGDTIRKYDLGWDGERITLPVYDKEGDLVNVRRYKIHGSGSDKMLNVPGHGAARILGLDILEKNKTVVFAEGEWDYILSNQMGIPTIAHTGGAGTFKPEWMPLFEGKIVFFCFDADDTGRKGAAKAARVISPMAEAVYRIEVPEPDKKSADITDYYVEAKKTADDFRELMAAASFPKQRDKVEHKVPDTGKPISLLESMSEGSANSPDPLEIVVSVVGKSAAPSAVPQRMSAICDMSAGKKCLACPVNAFNGHMTMELQPDDPTLFRFLEAGEDRQKKLLREISGAKCRDAVDFEIDNNYVVEELVVQPPVDVRNQVDDQQQVKRSVYSINTHKTQVNRKARLVGRNVVDSRNSHLQFMSWMNEPVDTDLDQFVMTPEIAERLRQFQPDKTEGELPLAKCLDIARDLSENVTHIYDSDILHVAYDLVWHSALSFKVHDTTVDKGWIEILVIGDTRTGKSEMAKQLSRHYNSGQVVSCEGMSFAGIVGGVQQIGTNKSWHMTWGVVPLNDRRLVVLDEMSGLKDKDVIEQMSSIRSSGIAQITKINSDSTNARTRLIWISNPGDGSMINDNPKAGMHAIGTVVNNAEDIARFDFCVAVSAKDVNPDIINSGFQEHHSPRYASEDCSDLVMWAWSRKRNDILVADSALKELTKQARKVGRSYVPEPPLIQVQNVRYKILRIAIAIAMRTFSAHTSNFNKVVVDRSHIDAAVDFLNLVYRQPSMGYAKFSERTLNAEREANSRKLACKAYLLEFSDSVLLTLRMVGGRTFRTRDFTDFGGLPPDQAQIAANRLLNWQMAMIKTRGDLAMSQTLIDVLKEIAEEGDI